jgi:uncharacterized protein YecE (DUF72 family)
VYLAQFVDMIEINSSFYRIPSARSTLSWSRRAADKRGFFFTAKLHRDFTHAYQRDNAAASEFRTAFEPLQRAGLLHGVLAQFRYDFTDCEEARRLLDWIRREFGRYAALTLELRHRSWQTEDALEFITRLGINLAELDYPGSSDGFKPLPRTVGEQLYFRLHGRNRKAWFDRDADVNETYDYDYSNSEIKELADRSRKLRRGVKSLTIVANNHYRGKAVSAALRLKAELTGNRVAVPPALLETYPQLAQIALPPSTQG